MPSSPHPLRRRFAPLTQETELGLDFGPWSVFVPICAKRELAKHGACVVEKAVFQNLQVELVPPMAGCCCCWKLVENGLVILIVILVGMLVWTSLEFDPNRPGLFEFAFRSPILAKMNALDCPWLEWLLGRK